MRTVSAATTAAWLASYKGGTSRPCVRATIQKLNVTFTQYDRAKLKGATRKTKGTGVFASLAFGQRNVPKELPNIKSVTWNRSLDADAAECTITLWNTAPLPLTQAPAPGFEQDFDRLGWFTPDRGKEAANERWGLTGNRWANMLVPDRVIRTYEGYGYDAAVVPELDENLHQTGAWIIDEVDYSHDGIITVKCRDYASVLLSQIMFPPVVPWADYPLAWEKYHKVDNDPVYMWGGWDFSGGVTTAGAKWFRPVYQSDSNTPYIGKGFTDGGRPYVDTTGAVLGHHGRHAFDGSPKTYWMSVGNMPNWSSSYEYVQGTFSSRSIAAVKVRTWGGPYICYVSVKVDGKWQGARKIPYRYRAVDTDADIPYVTRKQVDKNEATEIRLPKAYANATAVRITFTDLYNSGIGHYKWRAGIKDVQVLQATSATSSVVRGQHVEGNYGDYSDIVLWLLCWAGFFWPEPATGQSFFTYSDGNKVDVTPASPARHNDNLPKGTLWGDWMPTGTYGISLGVPIWDKKPIMDGIRYIKDIVGFNFFVDETGGAVWRLPNIFVTGNYLSGVDGGQHANRTSDVITIDEATTLQSLRANLSSRNVRERVFIASTDGKTGALAGGYNPAPSGLRRVGGWTDQHFTTTEECQVMADMIVVRQMFEYRTDTIVIPANPAIQIDDQVRIQERTTAETALHYVKGISSELDMVTGKWTYTLQTHWLGDSAYAEWSKNLKLAPETKRYLKTLGAT